MIKTGNAVELYLKGKRDDYAAMRVPLELQWVKNLRQYKGVYDPELISKIPKTKSKVYPKDTHTKIVGFVAKLMEMMFPATDCNFSIQASENPNVDAALVGQIVSGLLSKNVAITDDILKVAIKEYAQESAKAMEDEIKDQLSDIGGNRIEYPQLAKKVIRSAAIYGFGVLCGPKVRTQKETIYTMSTNGVSISEEDLKRPYVEHVRSSDIYPDLSAKTWRDQEGIFERLVFNNKNQLRDLAKRDDFNKSVIYEYLKDNPNGNYSENSYDTELNTLKHTGTVKNKSSRRYEVFRYVGVIPGAKLKEGGYKVSDDDIDFDIFCDVYLLDGNIIKLDMEPFATNVGDEYHVFVIEEDEDAPLTGTGYPEILRDSQMKICAVDRAIMDNMAATAGPIFEVNEDLLSRGYDADSIRAFSTIYREGRGPESQVQAVRAIHTESHVNDLLALRAKITEVFDVESNLPSWLMGNTQPLGEAFRTSNNMSMMQGGANMITKDVVRSFDRFTSSLIGSLVRWNMALNPKTTIKGDHQVVTKGNYSLVAKEVRGAAMEQFMQTLTPDERALFKLRKTLVERMRMRDLPEEYLEDIATCDAILKSRQEDTASAQQVIDGEIQARTQSLTAKATKDMATAKSTEETTDAKIAEIIARVKMYMSTAKGVEDRGKLENIKTLLEHIGDEKANTGAIGTVPEGNS